MHIAGALLLGASAFENATASLPPAVSIAALPSDEPGARPEDGGGRSSGKDSRTALGKVFHIYGILWGKFIDHDAYT